ncbi:Crp/Fnr family transcriptional regulator [Mitsuaria sp. GD03876]|uniref:Crp/Fnr family transcriptional regulator n=1 Tax=Mitsuaria sp. GD03876 TaxID=2975399 RepID=UPI00244D2202|nr:Crp/Fnr family transcriptional regulator [Mitsuaria sp. GD03876]MDH0865760.1 Crp/Fnr family transcriptional regulator [Mitsuaria sp. GD03876]
MSLSLAATPSASSPRANQLLAQMPPEDQARWSGQLETVELLKGRVLFEAGSPALHVYFPITAIVSLIHTTHSGASAQVAMIGSEGAAGLAAAMGGESPACRAVVQRAGLAFRMRVPMVREELTRGGAATQRLLRYLQSLLTQVAHTAVCNRHHSLERQLCRWLLLCLDRQHGHCELSVTQELISSLLGVRREGVTESAQRLQAAGLIRYSRGHIAVLDRPGLEARACECYALLKQDFLRLLPQDPDGANAATSATFASAAVQA